MKKILYILLILSCSVYGQHEMMLGASQAQYANETPAFDSGLILNGTFEDSNDLVVGANFEIINQTGRHKNTGSSSIDFLLSESVVSGTDVTFTLDLVSEGTQGRFGITMVDATTNFVNSVGFITYNEGSVQINFNYVGADAVILRLKGSSSSPDAFTIDNVKLTKD